MLTLKKVNKLLAEKYPDLELECGEGYFWVCGVGTENWYETMIYADKLNHLTIDQWIESVEYLIEKNKEAF